MVVFTHVHMYNVRKVSSCIVLLYVYMHVCVHVHAYVTVSGKTNHFAQNSDIRYWYHVVVRYSLHAIVMFESR